MKITIEAETPDEKKQFPEKKVIKNIFEFALVGRFLEKKISKEPFSHIHKYDIHQQYGDLTALRLRLLG